MNEFVWVFKYDWCMISMRRAKRRFTNLLSVDNDDCVGIFEILSNSDLSRAKETKELHVESSSQCLPLEHVVSRSLPLCGGVDHDLLPMPRMWFCRVNVVLETACFSMSLCDSKPPLSQMLDRKQL